MQQKTIKVFVADGHPVVALGLSTLLKNTSGKELVGQATSSLDLVKHIRSSRPDVIFLDLALPGADFEKNIQCIKETAPRAKVIMFSGYHTPDLARSLCKLGVHGVLLKNLGPSEILQAIDDVFAGKQHINAEPDHSILCEAHNGNGIPSDTMQKRLRLSKREKEVLVLISEGMTSQGIGKQLFISKYTVETHRKNILRKLELSSSTELVKFAIQQGLV
jgi:DNA-binding NarL/FixJ family response regulator